ncbi:putative manganese-dependent inorganic pyrophosphatase [Luteitalea pratensis]|uniref:Putative manganese-dependent inorganic pyrophosphatase n=1 Tax=Luteitalea pratensis TaxID=1855912 RepID=A0A143PRM8_LUTPR|nr:CBS domain-containing protein [Luteitalea pratensis]AMY10760.1 putative manganese-dependent inorganic pyrophosphatase [Luteitalea pratensis]
MRVEDIMERAVEAADASMPAGVAWDRMRRRGLRMFAIVDRTGIVGIVTRDQLGGHGAPTRRDRTLGDFVRTDVLTTTPDCPVTHAAAVLSGRTQGCLPVLRGTQLVGVLTIAQLLEKLAHAPHMGRAAHVCGACRESEPDQKGHRVS